MVVLGRGGVSYERGTPVHDSEDTPSVFPHKGLGMGYLGGESGPFRAVHLSRHKWPGGLVN